LWLLWTACFGCCWPRAPQPAWPPGLSGCCAAAGCRFAFLRGVFRHHHIGQFALDAIGHQVSRHFGISVQGWAAGLAIWEKAWLSILIGLPSCCSSTGGRVSPRRYWVWLWLVTLR